MSRRTTSLARLTLAALLCQAAVALPALAQATNVPPLNDFTMPPRLDVLDGPILGQETLNLACGPAQTTVTVTFADGSGVRPVAHARLDGPDGATVEVDLPRIDGSRVVSRHRAAVTLPTVGTWTLTSTGTDEQGGTSVRRHHEIPLTVIDDPARACPPSGVRYALSRATGTVSWTNPAAGNAAHYRVENGWSEATSPLVPASSTSADVSNGVPDDTVRHWRVVPLAADGTPGTPSAWSNRIRRQGSGLGPARIDGADRYSTAAGLTMTYRYFGQYDRISGPSQEVGTVYLATGLSHADALGAGPAAATAGGPVLLTPPDGLNFVVRSTLDRLNPNRIVVVGGQQAISDAVFDELAPYAYGGRVDRIAGADRYATAAAIAMDEFTPDDGQRTPVVFVADGVGYADALSGGAVAAGMSAPMLLTAPGALPAATADALAALRPDKIVVLGGESAVSSAVADALASYTAVPVQRVAGTDRYDTSAKIAQTFLPTAGVIYLASGASFPDALASVAVAGPQRAALLLSRQDCLPRVVHTEMLRLAPVQDPWIVGGTAALSAQVAEGLVCE